MSGPPSQVRQNSFRFSREREGFQRLGPNHHNNEQQPAAMSSPENIPLETVVTHSTSNNGTQGGKRTGSTTANNSSSSPQMNEKSGLFHRGVGRRKMRDQNRPGYGNSTTGEETTLNRMGRFYTKILNFSIITRYFIYVLPLAIIIAIPIVIGATVAPNAVVGHVKLVWLFTWVEVVWLSLWVSKIFAHFLPRIFEFLMGVVSSGTRKYAQVIEKLEIPLSLAGWALCSLATFSPLMNHNPAAQRAADAQTTNGKPRTADQLTGWQKVMQQLLAAALVCTLVFLIERIIVQLISINYHRKQFDVKIKSSKRNVYLLGLLYDASRSLFPAYCQEFAEEDYLIHDSLDLMGLGSKKGTHQPSGTATPARFLHDVGRFGDKITSVFGNVAHEITGKQVFNPNSAHSIVIEALERNSAAEALAKRLWMSFVVEGRDALYQEDIVEVLGNGREADAEECFGSLDRDGNGDISLDEMILTVTEFGRERKAIANSMHDVDQAINVLDNLLCTVVFIICIFIVVAFLNQSFVTTLATAGTALLSLSFVFAATCQEVLGSCIFIFVKHPYDIGDRIDLSDAKDQLTVEHISLLFTVFKRVNTGRMVQIPNIVLNSVWIENVSRSAAMREQISMYVNFDTSFEDIRALKNEMQAFVLDKDNSRDFQPDIDVEVTGIAEMNKLELRVEIRHKSNWANETIRAARRSKFMCALVLALRKVPIYGPGAGDAGLGSGDNPTFSVAISPEDAKRNKDSFAATKEAKRLFPTKKSPSQDNLGNSPTTSSPSGPFPGGETKAMNSLNARNPAQDHSRDNNAWAATATGIADDAKSLASTTNDNPRSSQADLDEVRGLLHRQSTRGKRKTGGGSGGYGGNSQSQSQSQMQHYPHGSLGENTTALPPMREGSASGSGSGLSYQNTPSQAYTQGSPLESHPPTPGAYGPGSGSGGGAMRRAQYQGPPSGQGQGRL
ncbi:hypothetical protein K402DRAFT_376380 [Aulographum hederae CBS 113979]|uniref:EF-hand domain-containing protein n=1 Tax=Aulographum hederae CBS 113979 TaxID=1176131 RepID=A0A6G1H276_9PEZI|nr:hypothetical protein K402DRAFT_376380 [Aulographum hederae CBS 113979]